MNLWGHAAFSTKRGYFVLKGHGRLVLRTKQVCFCAEEQKNEGVRTKRGCFVLTSKGVFGKSEKNMRFLKKKFGGFNFIRTFAIPNGKMRK